MVELETQAPMLPNQGWEGQCVWGWVTAIVCSSLLNSNQKQNKKSSGLLYQQPTPWPFQTVRERCQNSIISMLYSKAGGKPLFCFLDNWLVLVSVDYLFLFLSMVIKFWFVWPIFSFAQMCRNWEILLWQTL